MDLARYVLFSHTTAPVTDHPRSTAILQYLLGRLWQCSKRNYQDCSAILGCPGAHDISNASKYRLSNPPSLQLNGDLLERGEVRDLRHGDRVEFGSRLVARDATNYAMSRSVFVHILPPLTHSIRLRMATVLERWLATSRLRDRRSCTRSPFLVQLRI